MQWVFTLKNQKCGTRPREKAVPTGHCTNKIVSSLAASALARRNKMKSLIFYDISFITFYPFIFSSVSFILGSHSLNCFSINCYKITFLFNFKGMSAK